MIPVFVISLNSECKRKEMFKEVNHWLDFHFFTAIDFVNGRAPLSSLFGKYMGKNDFSPGALGCLISHRALWRKLLNSDHEAFIIFEDDVVINQAGYERWLKIIKDKLNFDFDLFFLGAHDGRSIPDLRKIRCIAGYCGIAAEPFDNTLYCAYAYIITRTGAKKMLNKTKMGIPVDYWGHFNREKDMNYLVAYPNIAMPGEAAHMSSIQKNKAIRPITMLEYLRGVVTKNIRELMRL